jgi:uncharacterized protein (TIGR03435 family)
VDLKRILARPALISFIACASVAAQTYDVASIHKSDPAEQNVHMGSGPQGGLRTVNTTAAVLIGAAYHVQLDQIIGAPGWVTSEHFDVAFTPDKSDGPEESSNDKNMLRLQSVLRDRFGLAMHQDTRELPIYSLTEAKGGNKLAVHPDDQRRPTMVFNNSRQIRGSNETTGVLASYLEMALQRPVRDDTGLNGHYDIDLNWTPDLELTAAPSLSSKANPLGSMFTEISNQLGLRLESKKGPLPVYVIDKIERPTEN